MSLVYQILKMTQPKYQVVLITVGVKNKSSPLETLKQMLLKKKPQTEKSKKVKQCMITSMTELIEGMKGQVEKESMGKKTIIRLSITSWKSTITLIVS